MAEQRYKGIRVLVTGGLGFIGSNLVRALVREGAEVTVVDGLISGCGGDEYNVAEVRDRLRVIIADIGDREAVSVALADQQVIFNLAGEVSHSMSISCPERDLRLNALAQLRFLESCRVWAPQARIVYASSRQIYGRPRYLPVDERHPVDPVDFNGVHKWAAECYHRLQARLYDQPTVVLRLTNVYGPRQSLRVSCQGFIATFIARALRREPVLVYGDGSQLRDMLYVDDVVEAFLLAGLTPLPSAEPYLVANVGGPRPMTLSEIARTLVGDDVHYVPFPAISARIDIGSYHSDDRLFRAWTGWQPRVDFAEGIVRTLEFYRQHAEHYLHGAVN